MGAKDNEALKRSSGGSTWIKSKMRALRPGKNKVLPVQKSSSIQAQSSESTPVQPLQPQHASGQINQSPGSINAKAPIAQKANPSEEQKHDIKAKPPKLKQSLHRAKNKNVPDQENIIARPPNIETPRILNPKTPSQTTTFTHRNQAPRRPNAAVYALLQNNGFDLASPTLDKEKALLWCIKTGYENAVKVLLIDQGANSLFVDDHLETFLHKVAYTPHDRVLQALLSSPIKVDASNSKGLTALHIAAAHGREALARRLVDVGADPSAKTPQQYSTLDLAIESEDERTVHFFLDKGLETPLCFCGGKDEFRQRKAADGLHTVAQLLVAQRIEARDRSGSGLSSLHVMAEKGEVAGVRLLLKKAVDVTAVDKLGRSAVHFAAKGGQRRTIQMLVEHHAGKLVDS